MQPSTNVWVGGRSDIGPAPALEGDCLFDLRFRIERSNPATSLSFGLAGGGADAEQAEVFLHVGEAGDLRYTVYKGRLRSGSGLPVTHAITEERIAEDEQLPPALKDHDWLQGSKLTLKREGGSMQFFVNDEFVREFPVSKFPVRNVSVGVAGDSTVVVTSLEARAPQ
jgi:hypothetical protein